MDDIYPLDDFDYMGEDAYGHTTHDETTAYDDDGDGQIDRVTTITYDDYYMSAVAERSVYDTDGDGIIDATETIRYDDYGSVSQAMVEVDYTQDGEADLVQVYSDDDGDGTIDRVQVVQTAFDDPSMMASEDMYYDIDGDQETDVARHTELVDLTGNGEPDVAVIDINAVDGRVYHYEMSFEEFAYLQDAPGIAPVDNSGYSYYGQYDPQSADPSAVSGDPASDMARWEYQGDTARCAVYAQKFAIEEALGYEVSIDELVDVAVSHGWLDDSLGGGTYTLDMAKLLEYYGVKHEMTFDNSINDLETALQEGKNVIVSIDSKQVWYGESPDIFTPGSTDHAVQVIGIDRSDPANPMVVLNDSGSISGCGELVPLQIFENSWTAGDSFMIVCNA